MITEEALTMTMTLLDWKPLHITENQYYHYGWETKPGIHPYMWMAQATIKHDETGVCTFNLKSHKIISFNKIEDLVEYLNHEQ